MVKEEPFPLHFDQIINCERGVFWRIDTNPLRIVLLSKKTPQKHSNYRTGPNNPHKCLQSPRSNYFVTTDMQKTQSDEKGPQTTISTIYPLNSLLPSNTTSDHTSPNHKKKPTFIFSKALDCLVNKLRLNSQ